MDWTQAITIIGVNIALIGVVAGFLIFVLNRIDGDIKNLGNQMDAMGNRLDSHAARIDQLYRMFVDLLKQKK